MAVGEDGCSPVATRDYGGTWFLSNVCFFSVCVFLCVVHGIFALYAMLCSVLSNLC